MATIAIIPATRRWRSFLEKEAVRIFAGIGGSTRNKLRSKLLADGLSKGVPRDLVEADVAEAMDFLDARIALYEHARDANPVRRVRGKAI